MDLMQTELGAVLNKFRAIRTQDIWQKVFLDKTLSRMILEMIQQDQLFKQGIDEDGDIIGTYSEWTEMLNPDKVAGTPYTLFDTGAFYESMKIVVLNDAFVVEAQPIKIDENGEKTDLFENYGEGIIGLTDENKEKLAIAIKARFIIEVNKLLQ
jgi:hypothetical protein